MRFRLQLLGCALALCAASAAAQPAAPPSSSGQPTRKTVLAKYSPNSWEPVRPAFALSSKTSGPNSAKITVPFVDDRLSDGADTGSNEVSVQSWTIGPTFTFATSPKSPLVSYKHASSSVSFGEVRLHQGLLLAYTRQAPLLYSEELAAMRIADPIVVRAVQKCIDSCDHSGKDPFCKPKLLEHARKYPNSVDASQLCAIGKKALRKAKTTAMQKIVTRRKQRLRFPELDFSFWIGAGASKFTYYEQKSAAAGTTPAQYASTSRWKPNGAAAMELTMVPWNGDDGPLGFTLELPAFAKLAYQASKTSGTACSSKGSLTTNNASLSSCDPAEPIGAPKPGVVLDTKAYVGIVDKKNAYWRAALGGGYEFNFVDSSVTMAIEIPVYINATALGAGKSTTSGATDASGSGKKSPVAVDYDGIVRITPTLTADPFRFGKTYAVSLNLELLGKRNLFTQADTLVQ